MYSRKDIAKILKVSITLVLLWERQGYLPHPDRKTRPCAWSRETFRKFCKDKRMVNAYA